MFEIFYKVYNEISKTIKFGIEYQTWELLVIGGEFCGCEICRNHYNEDRFNGKKDERLCQNNDNKTFSGYFRPSYKSWSLMQRLNKIL